MTTSYATYTYYTNTYLGTVITSADFAQLALRASSVLDSITYNRVAAIVLAATETALIDSIKMATCYVAEKIQEITAAGAPDGIQSESVGNSSVSYKEGAEATKSTTRKYTDAASLYLGSSGLMFKGFSDDEYGEAPTDDY
jgi:hypothetical protein